MVWSLKCWLIVKCTAKIYIPWEDYETKKQKHISEVHFKIVFTKLADFLEFDEI